MRRIMVLDDSSVVRKVAKRILAGDDSIVVEAEKGCECLDMCEVDMPDIVLCDQQISDMKASELIAAIKSQSSSEAPVVYLTLHEMDLPAIMRAKRAGADGFIMKPFNRRYLIDRFDLLERQRMAHNAA